MNEKSTSMASTQRTMPQLIKTVNALYDKAKNADSKAEQLWITLGIELKEAKARNKEAGDLSWAVFAKQHFNFGQSRADELIRIADGKTTVDAVRDGNTKRSIERREAKQALRNAEAKREARYEKEHKKTTDAIVKGLIDAGKLTEEQIADHRDREIMPPYRLNTACGTVIEELGIEGPQSLGVIAAPVAETPVDLNPEASDIVSPEVLEDNMLHVLKGMNENARIFNNFFKISAFDREAATRIVKAIGKTIGKLRSVKSTLEKKENTAAVEADDADQKWVRRWSDAGAPDWMNRYFNLLAKYQSEAELTEDESDGRRFVMHALGTAQRCSRVSEGATVNDDVLEAATFARDAWSELVVTFEAKRSQVQH